MRVAPAEFFHSESIFSQSDANFIESVSMSSRTGRICKIRKRAIQTSKANAGCSRRLRSE